MTTIDIFVGLVFRWGSQMLPTTSLKNELAWTLAFFTMSGLSLTCFAQEESLQEPAGKPQSSVFEKLFGKSTASAPEAKKAKPKVPAIPATGKPSRTGFLVPLRSFSRSFRGQAESEESEGMPETQAPSANSPSVNLQPRIPREPFRNLPRVQERRERDAVDLQVEKILSDSTSAGDRITPQNTAPIVSPETFRSGSLTPSNSKSAASKPSPSKAVVAGSSKNAPAEILIESNSTSRRTAMDTEPSDKTRGTLFVDQPLESPRSQKGTQPELTSKAYAGSKGLIDLGFPLDKPTKSVDAPIAREVASPQATSKTSAGSLASNSASQSTSSRNPSQANEIQKISPPASSPKLEARNASMESNAALKNTISKVPVATASIRREMSAPGVRVTVNGPSSLLVNDPGRFEIVAKNEGSESLNGLIVRVAVPTHVSVSDVAVTDGTALPENDQEGNTIIWELGQIPAGSTKTAVVSLKTPKPEHFALGVEWTVIPQSAEMQIDVQQPQLAIALEGPSEVVYGKPQLYRIRVRNTGNAEVRNVAVAMSAEPYGSNQSDIGDISAGSERIVEVELTFQQSGTLPIVATAISDVSKVDARAAIDVQVRQSELAAQWYGPSEFYQGSVVDYELELSNTGAIAAVGTNCIVKLPAGAEVVSMPPSATRSGDFIKWDVMKIEPNEKVNIPLRLSLSRIGDNQLAFVGTCVSSNEAKAEFKTHIDAIADLHLTVVDPVAPAPVGQPVIYEVVIANRGKKSANDIEVIAQFSEGIEPVRVDGHTGRIVPGQAIFNVVPLIGANEKLVLRIHAEASKPGVHRFRVEVKSKGSDTDLLEEESTRYLATSIKGERR